MEALYPYRMTNSQLVKAYQMIPHPEGGHYVETYRSPLKTPNPFVAGSPERNLHTTIYYLMTPNTWRGSIHQHSSDSMHFVHQGRARIQMLRPDGVETIILGDRTDLGEQHQAVVPANVWKAISLPPEDVALATQLSETEKIGCLMSEVVVPGFSFEDHKFLTKSELEDLFANHKDREALIKEFAPLLYNPPKEGHQVA